MAAKLKKRALAEYQSQVEDQDESQQKQKTNKKLKLLMPRTSTRYVKKTRFANLRNKHLISLILGLTRLHQFQEDCQQRLHRVVGSMV